MAFLFLCFLVFPPNVADNIGLDIVPNSTFRLYNFPPFSILKYKNFIDHPEFEKSSQEGFITNL